MTATHAHYARPLNPVLRIDNGGNLCAPFQQIQ